MKIPANGFTHAGKFHADDVFATDCINPQPRNGICRSGAFLRGCFSTLHKFRSCFLAMVRMDSPQWL